MKKTWCIYEAAKNYNSASLTLPAIDETDKAINVVKSYTPNHIWKPTRLANNKLGRFSKKTTLEKNPTMKAKFSVKGEEKTGNNYCIGRRRSIWVWKFKLRIIEELLNKQLQLSLILKNWNKCKEINSDKLGDATMNMEFMNQIGLDIIF